GGVTEGADHRDPGALVGLGQRVGVDGGLHVVQRGGDGGAEQVLVALGVGMGDQGHAGGQQLGPGGLDEHLLAGAVGAGEADAVVGGLALAVLLLGLGDGGAVGHVPHGGGLGLIGLSGGEVV